MRKPALLVLLALIFTLGFVQVGSANPISFGPTHPVNHFPLWYSDSNGLKLQLCLNPGVCAPAPVDPTSPFSVATGFGIEAIYYSLVAKEDPGTTPAFNFVVSLTGTYAPDPITNVVTIADGFQTVFAQVDVSASGLPSAGPWTVTHPWGTAGPFTASPDPKNPLLFTLLTKNTRIVVPVATPAGDFSSVLGATFVGPFLGNTAGNIAGFITNGIPSPITPGPNGAVMSLSGGGVTITQPNLIVTGQISTQTGASITKAAYVRTILTDGKVIVTANADTGKLLTARIGIPGAALPVTMLESLTTPGTYTGTVLFPAGALFSPIVVKNHTDVPVFKTKTTVLVDNVKIKSATFSTGTRTLTVNAASQDKILQPSTTLTLRSTNAAGAVLATKIPGNGIMTAVIPAGVTPPTTVFVGSTLGGSATSAVTTVP